KQHFRLFCSTHPTPALRQYFKLCYHLSCRTPHLVPHIWRCHPYDLLSGPTGL
ncbi:hypothetical protein ID866_13376, partial [Astraeus odoratus]